MVIHGVQDKDPLATFEPRQDKISTFLIRRFVFFCRTIINFFKYDTVFFLFLLLRATVSKMTILGNYKRVKGIHSSDFLGKV